MIIYRNLTELDLTYVSSKTFITEHFKFLIFVSIYYYDLSAFEGVEPSYLQITHYYLSAVVITFNSRTALYLTAQSPIYCNKPANLGLTLF